MLPDDDRHHATLIDRLTATTVRLRNLFYVNLILAWSCRSAWCRC